MNENEKFPQQAQTGQGGNNKTILIVVIVILIIIAGGLLAWYFLQEEDATNTNNANTVSNSNSTSALNTASDIDAPEKNTVWIVDTFFNPSVVTIEVGDTVTWVNKDEVDRQIASDPYPTSTDLPELVSDVLSTGDEYQFTFEEAGSFVYHDKLNPISKGTIIVK